MSKPVKRIPIDMGRPVGRSDDRKRGFIKHVRKESNREIMQKSLVERGFIRLNLYPRVKTSDGTYLGFHGVGGIIIDCPSIDSAEEFLQEIRWEIYQRAQAHGFKLPNNVMIVGEVTI